MLVIIAKHLKAVDVMQGISNNIRLWFASMLSRQFPPLLFPTADLTRVVPEGPRPPGTPFHED